MTATLQGSIRILKALWNPTSMACGRESVGLEFDLGDNLRAGTITYHKYSTTLGKLRSILRFHKDNYDKQLTSIRSLRKAAGIKHIPMMGLAAWLTDYGSREA